MSHTDWSVTGAEREREIVNQRRKGALDLDSLGSSPAACPRLVVSRYDQLIWRIPTVPFTPKSMCVFYNYPPFRSLLLVESLVSEKRTIDSRVRRESVAAIYVTATGHARYRCQTFFACPPPGSPPPTGSII